MDVSTSLIVIAVLYCILYFFDIFFKSCSHYPYIQFLKGTGFEIKFLQLGWKTTAFNRMLLRWGSGHTKFLHIWFTVGLYVTLIALPLSIVLLLVAVFQHFHSRDTNALGSYVLEPAIPGVNLPPSELGYYSITLVVCSIVHELGHALAAVKDDVHITDVGVHCLFIMPIAYVSLASDDLQRLNPWRALRIFCAGVWHNIVLSLVVYLLYLSLPLLFSLLFFVDNGVTVTNVAKYSPLLGTKGLNVGDRVVKINNCLVTDVNSWNDCLHKARFSRPSFCVSADLVHALDESIPLKHNPNNGEFECCGPDRTGSACFEYVNDNNNGILELPPHACLPIRSLVDQTSEFCDVNSNICPGDLHCIRPLLYNSTNLFKISCSGRDVVYLGYAGDLLHTVSVSSYISKHKLYGTAFPDRVEKICAFIVMFSLGLAIVNVIPCLAMDGHHIFNCIIRLLFARRLKSEQNLHFISLVVPLCGTVLIAALVLHTVWEYLVF